MWSGAGELQSQGGGSGGGRGFGGVVIIGLVGWDAFNGGIVGRLRVDEMSGEF
jgi:hypothetical protein